MRELEYAFLDAIQRGLQSSTLDFLMPAITALGNSGLIWIILGLVLLLRKPWRRMGMVLLVALLLEAVLCNVILKNLFAVPRPFEGQEMTLLIPAPQDYSFPSGHTGAAFATVSALFFIGMRRWYLVLIPAVVIAFSRLYLYVHYPSDVVGGIVVGIISGWLSVRLFTVFEQRRSVDK